MRKTLAALLLAAWCFTASAATTFTAPYGVQNEFPFEIWSTDGLSVDVDESDDGDDVVVLCNAGTQATSTNDYTDEGSSYSLVLTAAEMQCETLTVIVDEAVDTVFYIQTINNASGRIPTHEANVASASTASIENQDFATAPGASGGLLISGSNAGTTTLGALTITGATTHTGNVSMAAGLNITQSSSNTAALVVTGNGTGNGATFTSGSGATGNGIAATAASTNGNGFATAGTGTGAGSRHAGGATGAGTLHVGGSTSGLGVQTSITAPSGSYLENGLTYSGTLNGSHNTTTADLGTNAPANDITGSLLVLPDHDLRLLVTAYNTGTGVVTFDTIIATLANGNDWYLFGLPVGSGATDVNVLTIEGADATTVLGTAQTGDAFARLGAPAGASHAADLLAIDNFVDDVESRLGTPSNLGGGATLAANASDIEAQTDDIGTAGAGLTAADDAVITLIGAAGAGLTAVDDAVLARLPAALISGRMASQVGGYESGQVPLQPTTAGRTLDVSAGGEAGIDWSNVGGPTSTVNLSGTTISTTQGVASVSGAVASVTAGVTVTTNNDKTGYTLSAGGVDAIWDEPQSGHATADTFGAYLDSSVSGVSTGGVSVGDIADAVWDEALIGHGTAGSAGKALTDAATSSVGTGTGLTSIPWNPSWDAEVQSEAEDAVNARMEQAVRADAAVINCEVNTANFAGSTTTLACVLTDRDSGAITAASGDLEGRELLILSGAQIYEGRFINDTTWDAANSELRLTLSRALPASLADAVTAIVR